MSKLKETVELYVLVIYHRMGEEVWPCDSKMAAELQLHRYVSEWWKVEMGEKSMPASNKAAVTAYFAAQAKKVPPAVPETFAIHCRDLVTVTELRASQVRKPRKPRNPQAQPKGSKYNQYKENGHGDDA